jgi:hypothetical protein
MFDIAFAIAITEVMRTDCGRASKRPGNRLEACATAALALSILAAGCGGSAEDAGVMAANGAISAVGADTPGESVPPVTPSPASEASPVLSLDIENASEPTEQQADGVTLGCSMQSGADFAPAFTDPRNLIVGPLVIVGGAELTPAGVVRYVGGNKVAVLVEMGHTGTLQIPEGSRDGAGLAYGPLPEGLVHLRDTHHTVTFVPCDGSESLSTADRPITFWMGGVSVRTPRCVPLDVFIDGSTVPRRIGLPLGRSC